MGRWRIETASWVDEVGRKSLTRERQAAAMSCMFVIGDAAESILNCNNWRNLRMENVCSRSYTAAILPQPCNEVGRTQVMMR